MPIGFAAIATGVSLAASAASTTGSFIQAGKQRRQQKEAEAAAVKAMDEARARLDVNYYKGLSIAKEPFELAREQALVQGAMGVEAVREADQRGAAAGVGRIQMAQERAAAATRADKSQQMQRLEEITAQEEARLAGQKASLDLAEAQGAQLAARDAQEASQQAMQQGLAGVVSLGTQVAALPELYGSKGQRDAAWYEKQQKRWGEEKTWDPDSWAATKTERNEMLLNPNLPYDEITNPLLLSSPNLPKDRSINWGDDIFGVGGFNNPKVGPLTPPIWGDDIFGIRDYSRRKVGGFSLPARDYPPILTQ
jgi:hypothetical protein